MTGRILFDGNGVKSQESASVEALSAFIGKPIQDGILDLGAVKLVQNSRKSGYYTVTAKDCSCPSRGYNPSKVCKHMRKFFAAKDEPSEPASHSLMNRSGFRPLVAGE